MSASRGIAAALLALVLSSAASAQQESFPLPPKDWPSPVMDRDRYLYLLADRLEYRLLNGDNLRQWDVQAWFGGDYNKLWLKSEGENVPGGSTESAEAQVLYARRISPFWNLQAGLRREIRPRPGQNYGVLALEGLAPYWFDVEASLFLRSGEVSGRVEAEYDQQITQRLILQPRVETNFAGSSDPARGVGSGINDVQFELRLRYEIRREIAPYIGYSWARKLGNTADIARAAGERVTERGLVAGIRLWF